MWLSAILFITVIENSALYMRVHYDNKTKGTYCRTRSTFAENFQYNIKAKYGFYKLVTLLYRTHLKSAAQMAQYHVKIFLLNGKVFCTVVVVHTYHISI